MIYFYCQGSGSGGIWIRTDQIWRIRIRIAEFIPNKTISLSAKFQIHFNKLNRIFLRELFKINLNLLNESHLVTKRPRVSILVPVDLMNFGLL